MMRIWKSAGLCSCLYASAFLPLVNRSPAESARAWAGLMRQAGEQIAFLQDAVGLKARELRKPY
jgi:hypothetical protein